MSHQRKSKIITHKDEYETPKWLFDLLDQEFHFDCDAAASTPKKTSEGFYTPSNSKCGYFLTDALLTDWGSIDIPRRHEDLRFFLNPPYSAAKIYAFMQKAYEESRKGALVVCLVPCATDTRWWHNYAMKAQEIRFIKGRVRFVGYDEDGKQVQNSPMFSSCVVIFDDDRAVNCSGRPFIGKTIDSAKKVK